MKQEPTVTKHPLYLVRDENGQPHWYTHDPLNPANLSSEVKIEHVITDLVGSGSRLNPVCVYLSCTLFNRGELFNTANYSAIKSNVGLRSVRDLEGHRVNILEDMNDDGEYPFNGMVLDANGTMIANRTYSLFGECSDGEEGHSLVIVYSK